MCVVAVEFKNNIKLLGCQQRKLVTLLLHSPEISRLYNFHMHSHFIFNGW